MAVCVNKPACFYTIKSFTGINIYCKGYKKYLLSLLAIFISLTISARQKSAIQQAQPIDSTQKDFISKMKKLGDEETKKSILKFNIEKEAIKQDGLIEDIIKTTQKANIFIKAGIDTVGINAELEKVKVWSALAGDGVFTNKGTAQTYRNLTSASTILYELLNRTNERKKQIDRYEKALVGFRYRIDSLSADSSLYNFPKDSLILIRYMQKIIIVANEIGPADKALKHAINNVIKLQTKVNIAVNKLNSSFDEVEDYQKALSSKTFDREFVNLWSEAGYVRPFHQILHFSFVKAKLNLWFYAQNNSGRVFLIFLLTATSTIFLRALKTIVQQENSVIDTEKNLVLRYPLLSAIVIILNLGQFIFPEPPFVFNSLFWFISSVCLTLIFRNFITRHWMIVWLTFLTLFMISSINNQILQASRVERWGMIFLAAAGVIFGLFVLLRGRKSELREKLILYFIVLVVLLELASIFANAYGRYNLSKTLLISGYLNVIIGILFLWTVRLINEGLCIASRTYTKQEKTLFFINFRLVGEKAPPLLYVLLVVGWFILFGRNFYVFRFISGPLKNFFFMERTIGHYSFTVNNLLVFFLILFLSVIISKVVSYFASEKTTTHITAGKERKAGLGSWLLLIRVFIMGSGLFLALAASGFPMERITIIIGALGVGIGFGLQTLVNNLVSGLIIAFEKPVNVGDIVEIAGQGGTMKSIGFRSSIISKWDGPDMVIPNGDLLNAHLINWTLAGSKRQMEILVGVAYGTNLQKAQQIITDLLVANERIQEHPKPSVLFQNFNSFSIDLKVTFWVRDYKDGSGVKSEMISAINALFKNNGIIIPFPQQDIYMHPLNDSDEKNKKTDKP